MRHSIASESHWLQPVLVLSIHWWSAPVGVGSVLVSSHDASLANFLADTFFDIVHGCPWINLSFKDKIMDVNIWFELKSI